MIHNLYANAKFCVRVSHLKSELFCCNFGIRQGKYLSPLLFSLFLNDLNEFITHAYNSLEDISGMSNVGSEMMKLKFYSSCPTTLFGRYCDISGIQRRTTGSSKRYIFIL